MAEKSALLDEVSLEEADAMKGAASNEVAWCADHTGEIGGASAVLYIYVHVLMNRCMLVYGRAWCNL